jgi:exopolysaccharide biosynthesis polyprenyl glycosylphosphotransferase
MGLLSGVGLGIWLGVQTNARGVDVVLDHLLPLMALRGGGSPFIWIILTTAIWLPVASAIGCYDLAKLSNWGRSSGSVMQAALITVLTLALIPVATPFLASRGVFFSICVSAVVLTPATRMLALLLMGQKRFRQRTMIVGAGWAGRTILKEIEGVKASPYEVLGFIDDDPKKLGQRVTLSQSSERTTSKARDGKACVRVLGNRQSIQTLTTQLQISTLVLAITHKVDANLMQILLNCLEHGIEIVPMPILYEELTGKVPLEHVGDNWYISMPISHRAAKPLYCLFKRFVDLGLSVLGLLCLAPLTPLLAVAIYLDCPGPIFYAQERLGKGGRKFRAWKFRSMIPNAESRKAIWAYKNASRVTRVGKWLRRTHLDEFPQFWNILKGEMSAVGPRPERPEFVQELEKSIPFYRTRLMVKPGMAGWGLVQQGYGASEEDTLIKLQYDLYYIKHQSIFLDIVILLQTFIDTFTFRGR